MISAGFDDTELMVETSSKATEDAIPFLAYRRLDDSSWSPYYEAEDDGYDETINWLVVSLTMVGAMLFGIMVFYYILWFFVVGPLVKEYKSQGKHIVGLVTGAKKKVRQDFHASVTPGLFYGGYINGTTTETTINRILDVEYPVLVNGERKIVRKIFRYLYKKTFDRPYETGEVELYLLRDRGILSAYPRDELHLSATEKCKQTFAGICFVALFGFLLFLGIIVNAPWYLFLAVFAMDILIAYGMCIGARNSMLRRGKVLRFVPGEAGECPFNFDVYDHDETEIHHDDGDGYHLEAAELQSAPPAPQEQIEIPFATVVERESVACEPESYRPKPTSHQKKSCHLGSGGSRPCESPKHNEKNDMMDHDADTMPPPTTKPVPLDVCFGDESHPGTIAWRKAIQEIIEEFADFKFGFQVHHAIKARVHDRYFWVKANHGEEWKLASNREVVCRFRAAFEKEQARFFQTAGGGGSDGRCVSLTRKQHLDP